MQLLAHEACIVNLDASASSELDWQREFSNAPEGPILWQLDFQLGSFCLSDQVQFQAIGLAIEHFGRSLPIELKERTVGVCLYDGSADFSVNFHWTTEFIERLRDTIGSDLSLEDIERTADGRREVRLFCRDAVVDYLSLLLTRLSDDIRPFLILDTSFYSNPLDQVFELSKECFEAWTLAVSSNAIDSCWWHSSGSEVCEPDSQGLAPIALLVPPQEAVDRESWGRLEPALRWLIEAEVPFRCIPAHMLTMEWAELDFVILDAEYLDTRALRQVQGFAAAAGTVVSVGRPLELEGELSWDHAKREILKLK